jgi:hypothetical protein
LVLLLVENHDDVVDEVDIVDSTGFQTMQSNGTDFKKKHNIAVSEIGPDTHLSMKQSFNE